MEFLILRRKQLILRFFDIEKKTVDFEKTHMI
jgi:hypothetical protein